MNASLRALLTVIIDYAGLFPPAKLPLDEAIRNYARYRTEPESWMLGRFVCPAARLGELTPFLKKLLGAGPPFVFSALGRGGNDFDQFLEGLRADMHDIAGFRQRHGVRVVVDVFEVRLPPDPLQQSAVVFGELFPAAVSLLKGQGVVPYFEVPAEQIRYGLSAVLQPRLVGGVKLRCGGQEASAFPTSAQVASVLVNCVRRGVRFKATAGLHHPIRHLDPQLQVPMHGFLNVFGAGVLAAERWLDPEQLEVMLEDTDPAHFVFEEEVFRWKGLPLPVEAIARARQERVISFGSCSFDEPREDLRALG